MRPMTAAILVPLMAACAAPAPSPSPAPSAMSEAERVVQEQVEAYNRHDVEAFVATYAPDAVLYMHPDRVMASGTEAIRSTYGPLFERVPNLRVRITQRIVQGDHVIDHELVSGIPGETGDVTAVAIYRVRNGRIQNVWLIQ